MIERLRSSRGKLTLTHQIFPLSFGGNAFLPSRALVPFSVDAGEPAAVAVVKVGDTVREGQLIARAAHAGAAHAHASVPGVVTRLVSANFLAGSALRAVEIRTRGSFEHLGKVQPNRPWQHSTASELLRLVTDAGVVATRLHPHAQITSTATGTHAGAQHTYAKDYGQKRRAEAHTLRLMRAAWESGNALATHLHLHVRKGVRKLTLYLCDDDATCPLSSFLAQEFPEPVATGTAIIARILDATYTACLHTLPKRSPGLARMRAVFPFNEMHDAYRRHYPFSNLSAPRYRAGCTIDALTAVHVYEAVVLSQPQISSYIALTGAGLKSPQVLRARIGTPLGALIEECGGFRTRPGHLIINGLLKGSVLESLDLPFSKGIKSLHVTGKALSSSASCTSCQNCGDCARICPVYLDPIKIARAAHRNQFTEEVLQSLRICHQCGLCSAACTARIPLAKLLHDAQERALHLSRAPVTKIEPHSTQSVGKTIREAPANAHR